MSHRRSEQPTVGDEVLGFRLCRELGRGRFATVFLAEPTDAPGQLVVARISAAAAGESRTLPQLRHHHIVPISACRDDRTAGLRVICMPFLGGASLSAVLGALWVETSQPTRTAQLIDALHSVEAPLAGGSRLCSLTCHHDYLRAVTSIIACLADGLHYAHERGIVHGDIKPANFLLTSDGRPLWLDFQLRENDEAPDGTVPYMAPEQLRALASNDPGLTGQGDRRADIYSLGVVFYEMLAGHRPFDPNYHTSPPMLEAMALERSLAVPSIRARRADVPGALESVMGKCLHGDPARRYQTASHLADDLRAFLDGLPLRHAPGLAQRLCQWVFAGPRSAPQTPRRG
jgi:serine/threonine protein kinase